MTTESFYAVIAPLTLDGRLDFDHAARRQRPGGGPYQARRSDRIPYIVSPMSRAAAQSSR